MADHPNAALLRSLYEAFGRADMATIDAGFADDVTFHLPGKGPLSGAHEGKQKVFELLGRLVEGSGGTFRLEVHDVLGNDEHAVGLTTNSASREGKSVSYQATLVAHLRDGKVAEVWEMFDDPNKVDEFWS
ncbi:MAG TPA: nuclear transport factor 2 family protein [Dehalococcoidia bacterium]|nr:nuclear transport factor 2 family protein [Dehalococcoidia bacterium]